MAAMQTYATVPLILQAEVFENAGGRRTSMTHAAGYRPTGRRRHRAAAAPAHEHERRSLGAGRRLRALRLSTSLANIVTGIGFALVLVAVSEFAGGIGNWRQGVFWGLAGFAVFTLAPGLGLPPELPAMPAADLCARQIWWIGTVAGDGRRPGADRLPRHRRCSRSSASR